jgi:hypothetical protein
VDIASLEHPLIAETLRLAPNAPRGQTRILAIYRPVVYRMRHGRWRGATWIEREQRRFWFARERSVGRARLRKLTSYSPRCTKPDDSSPTMMTSSATRLSATCTSSTARPTQLRLSPPQPSII